MKDSQLKTFKAIIKNEFFILKDKCDAEMDQKVKENMREICSKLKDSLEERRTDGDMSEVTELLSGKFEWFLPDEGTGWRRI